MIVATLKTTIAAKLHSKGIIGKLKELLSRLFQYLMRKELPSRKEGKSARQLQQTHIEEDQGCDHGNYT